MSDARHHYLPQRRSHRPLESGVIGWRKQMTVPQCDRSERNISRKLRLKPMTEMGSGRAHGKAGVLG
jgi:hypothetical protein